MEEVEKRLNQLREDLYLEIDTRFSVFARQLDMTWEWFEQKFQCGRWRSEFELLVIRTMDRLPDPCTIPSDRLLVPVFHDGCIGTLVFSKYLTRELIIDWKYDHYEQGAKMGMGGILVA